MSSTCRNYVTIVLNMQRFFLRVLQLVSELLCLFQASEHWYLSQIFSRWLYISTMTHIWSPASHVLNLLYLNRFHSQVVEILSIHSVYHHESYLQLIQRDFKQNSLRYSAYITLILPYSITHISTQNLYIFCLYFIVHTDICCMRDSL